MSFAQSTKPAPAVDRQHDDSFESLQARLLLGAEQRIHSDVEQAMRMGLIDGQGRRTSTELPDEMMPGAERDFGG